MAIPPEIMIRIFMHLEEDLIKNVCRRVCRYWYSISRDRTLTYYFYNKNMPIEELLIKSCELGNIISFSIAVDLYCANLDYPHTSTEIKSLSQILWAGCLVAAAKGGNMAILRKVLSFGPISRLVEAYENASGAGNLECANLIAEESNSNRLNCGIIIKT